MLIEYVDYNDAASLIAARSTTQWSEVEAVLRALPDTIPTSGTWRTVGSNEGEIGRQCGRAESGGPQEGTKGFRGKPPGRAPAAKNEPGSKEDGMQAPNWKSQIIVRERP